MSVFASSGHAASWAGLCPGNRESGGKRLSNRAKKGNRWLRRALCQSAWAVTHKKDCYLQANFLRRVAKGGLKKAILATAHQLLVIASCMMRDGTVYRELGGNHFDALRPQRTTSKLVRRLQKLGYQVILQPISNEPKPRRGRPCKCKEKGIDCKHLLAIPQPPTSFLQQGTTH
jgi:hypothetical protein